MFSLQKLLGRDDVFFDLLDKSAEEARESVRLLVQLLGAPDKGVLSLDEFALLRKKDKRITEELNTRLTQTFATPIEREDIEALSTALYTIPKTLEKFGERLLLSRSRVGVADFSRQVQLLESAIGTVNDIGQEMADAIEFVELGEMEDDEATIAEGLATLAALAERADTDKVQALLGGEADGNDTYIEVHAGAGALGEALQGE